MPVIQHRYRPQFRVAAFDLITRRHSLLADRANRNPMSRHLAQTNSHAISLVYMAGFHIAAEKPGGCIKLYNCYFLHYGRIVPQHSGKP